MWAGDRASQAMGMEIISVDEGRAILRMVVRDNQVNGHGTCHGGITYALADSAFAFACNSRNQSSVAQHNSISYLAPAKLGDVLTATGTEVALAGRSGLYDVIVTNEAGTKIAAFRGASRTIRGSLFEEEGLDA